MHARLTELMHRYAELLPDQYITEREGRFVIPVRADAHLRFPGIVHGTSGSGGTLFVEPRAVIPMGNRLKVLDGEVAREEEVIYTRLSARLCDHLPSVLGAAEAMARLDVCSAVARLAEEARSALRDRRRRAPSHVGQSRARHLLLGLEEKSKVVPSDLSVASSRAVVMSGPNAGGKTVALKTLGLCALLVRAGLPLPCGDDSEAGIFHVVLSDVGDDQSLHKSLSTFSASCAERGRHLVLGRIRARWSFSTSSREAPIPVRVKRSRQGSSTRSSRRARAVIATTHYEGLKALALADDRFENACVGFDLRAMMPTFKVTMGTAGASSALAVARRYGMTDDVIERAERFLAPEARSLDEELRRAHEQRVAAELAREAAERERERAAELSAQLDEERRKAWGKSVRGASCRKKPPGCRKPSSAPRRSCGAHRRSYARESPMINSCVTPNGLSTAPRRGSPSAASSSPCSSLQHPSVTGWSTFAWGCACTCRVCASMETSSRCSVRGRCVSRRGP